MYFPPFVELLFRLSLTLTDPLFWVGIVITATATWYITKKKNKGN